MVISYRRGDRAVFLYGYAKNERDNISDDELATFKEIASAWLQADSMSLERQITDGLAEEIEHEQGTRED
jgi:hypothetical protein